MHAEIFNVLLKRNKVPQALAIVDDVHDACNLVKVDALAVPHQISFDLFLPGLRLFCCYLLHAALLGLLTFLFVCQKLRLGFFGKLSASVLDGFSPSTNGPLFVDCVLQLRDTSLISFVELVFQVELHVHLGHLVNVICLLELHVLSFRLFNNTLDLILLALRGLDLLLVYVVQFGIVLELSLFVKSGFGIHLPLSDLFQVFFPS